jgi:hypothetical protein
MVQSAVAALARAMPSAHPSEVLAAVNHALWDGVRSRLEVDDHVTCSLFHVGIDGRVEYAGAHEDVLVARRSLARCERVETAGTWLALEPEYASKNRRGVPCGY